MKTTTINANQHVRIVALISIGTILAKLAGIINWPWLWVLAPLCVSAAVALMLLAVVLYTLARTGRDLSEEADDSHG